MTAPGGFRLLALALPLLVGACCQECTRLSQMGAVSAVGAAPTSAALAPNGSTGAPSSGSTPAVVGGGAEAVGAAIYVNAAGDLLTTWDQVADCRKLAVLDDSALLPAKVLAANPLRSLALLRTGRPTTVFARFRAAPPALGSTVHAVAYPILDGVPLPVAAASGSLRSASSPTGVDGIFQSSAVIAGQSPGGAVVDQQGEVIGITVARLEEDWPTGFTYGIATQPILRFTDAAGVELAESAATPTAAANDFIVPLICFR